MAARLLTAAVLISMLLVLGCGGSGADRVSGVRGGDVKTLTLANGFAYSMELQPWIDAVRAMSKGHLRIRVSNRWRDGELDYEAGLISDVRAGRVELGSVATRAWTRTGVHSFDALNVPFAIDSYASESAVLQAAGRSMLAGVAAASVEPVALLPGPMRLLLTRRPVERPADLRGLQIAIQASEVGENALRVLGTRPVRVAPGADIAGLDGLEQRLGELAAHYGLEAKYLLADAPLWPRPLVLFANRESWDSLSRDERGILEEAGARAFAATLRDLQAGDRAATTQLCHEGVHLVRVGTRGRAALRHAVAPVYEELRQLPDTRTGDEAVELARASGNVPDELACTSPQAPVAALTGEFTATFRRGEPGWQAIGDELRDVAGGIRFTLELRDGRAMIVETFPDGRTKPGFDEKYAVYRDRITLGGDVGTPLTARWELHGDELRFSEISGGPDDRFVWGAHPWIRTAR